MASAIAGGPLARDVQIALVLGDAVQQRQKLLGRHQTVVLPGDLHLEQHFVDAQLFVMRGAVEIRQSAVRFR